ncbi:ABC transporter permease [Bosea lathyri]|uniref:Amino acid/amide ABC transporter membrane protein 1, HAAT family /amino acid/amide ABC transporter membrane protein 2, HAAT family n=1 Tax=Bosea lathyri TaxID=1036778 RepID=A0A1H5UZE6_9HYPH|nr:ABC transporter permease [Bosea lathyri]SEF80485.1 amino acid/amide ABC transporter membrane protein 1, HAAT family /amino acid/amide ABC transporter membrane protein 2, HAAT family [Bosea lathyri]
MIDLILTQTLNGLASASSLFLVASGLSIIFGVTRIVNFAHGSLYMLGAYLAWTLVSYLGPADTFGFWGGVLLAALLVGLAGVLIEVLILRRIYQAPELFQLLATFGVVLMLQDLALATWGPEDKLGPRAPGFKSFVILFDNRFPTYELFLIAVGPLVLGLLWFLFQKTRWGTLVRAATQDREMVGALGVNQRLLFTSVFAFGSMLAGLGGALQLPREAVNLHMDLAMISEAFVVVVVGGLGSVTGAYLAAVLIGILHAFGILIFPKITLVLVFLVMAVVLVVKPYGLMGRAPVGHARGHGPAEPLLLPADRLTKLAGLLALALLALTPIFAPDYLLSTLTELIIFALFAASLHFMMGPGGMASFGHAAYFGLGAYGAALAVKWLGAPMEPALVFAPFLAGIAGVVFGWFCVRLSGVYLAMLTLAFAQIAWATAFQWVELTGGDNGILGVWPSAWASSKTAYFYLTLGVCAVSIVALRLTIFSPLGYGLRAARDNPLRAEAIGLDVMRIQWVAFIVAAFAAGIAGALFAFSKGSVFPTYMAIPRSVDALLMVLLGGVQTVSGPIIGAFAYAGLSEQLMKATMYWRFGLGLSIVLLVILFPRGLVGGSLLLVERWCRRPEAAATARLAAEGGR